MALLAGSRLEDHSSAGAAVHNYADGVVEVKMPDASFFGHRRLVSQPIPIDRAFARFRIHREIADLKRGQILEEMAALRRGDAKIAEPRFNDHTRAGDFVPLDRNTEPRIV